MLLGAYAAHLVDISARFGVEAEELLAPLGLTRDQLMDASSQLELPQLIALVDRARTLTGEPGLGVYLGLAMRASWHGYLGFALLTAGNIEEAISLGERFVSLRTSAFALSHVVEGNVAAVIVDERVDFGSARDVLVPALIIGLSTLGQALTGQELDGRIELALPRPEWFSKMELPRAERFSFHQPTNRLVFDAKLLRVPFQLADPAAQKLAEEQCERELAALGASGRFSARVRELLFVHEGIEAVAKALSMSSRTVKRRLSGEGTSYSELLDDERRARAMVLLEDASKSVKEVSAALGFADTAAFSHAFTRWTGHSPSEWRKR